MGKVHAELEAVLWSQLRIRHLEQCENSPATGLGRGRKKTEGPSFAAVLLQPSLSIPAMWTAAGPARLPSLPFKVPNNSSPG